MGGPRTIDLGDPEFWQDPYPEWRAARERHRTAVTATGEPIVLAADDLDLVATHPDFAQLGLGSLERLGMTDGPFYEWRRRTMNVVDGAEHMRLRGLVARVRSRRVASRRSGPTRTRTLARSSTRPPTGRASTSSPSTPPISRCG